MLRRIVFLFFCNVAVLAALYVTSPLMRTVATRPDLWGDTVNTASRMESYGLADEIQVTEAVRLKLDGKYLFQERAPITVKGKGVMVTYLLIAPEDGGEATKNPGLEASPGL